MQKIFARFDKMLDARKALDALKEQGYGNGYLDASDNFSQEYAEEISFGRNKTAPSLSGLVLRSRGCSPDVKKAPLIAASPLVSGMGHHEDISDSLKTRVIVNVEDDSMDKVKEVLRSFGGLS